MHVERLSWPLPDCGELAKLKQSEPDLIIYFGSRTALASGAVFEQLEATCPGAMVLGCTTGGTGLLFPLRICEFHHQTMTITTITELAV
jgi:hypothetical protein